MGRKIALLIGVGKYGKGLPPLNCPINGVEALRQVLEDNHIGGFDQVIPLRNPDVGTARRRIAEVFNQLSQPDLGLLYFTGHGIKDMSGEFYLTTADSQLFENGRINAGTALEAEFIKRVINNSVAQRKVVILDCCFGAAFAEGFLGMDDSRIDVETQLGGKGWCVLAASTSTRYALEQEGEPLSVYTRYLVEGLKTGGAAPEAKAAISVGDWHDYVRASVRAAAPAMEPVIFNAKQGRDILVAKAVIDAEQLYRKEVQSVVRGGKIFGAGRRVLKQKRQVLNLSADAAATIEASVLRPFQEKAANLAEYEAALREEIEMTFPLDEPAIRVLKRLQTSLNLRDEDLQPVIKQVDKEFPVVEALLRGPQPLQPATSPAPPAPSKNEAPTFEFETVTVDAQGNITERRQGKAEYRSEDLGSGITLELVSIPAGEFLMGAPADEEGRSDDEGPQHRVQVPEFWMGKFPVTQAQYQAVTGKNPSKFKGENRPVEKVSWEDAVAFCQKLSEQTGRTYRLPSEAEWEYACRAGTTTPFHFGETITPDLANYNGNYTYGSGPKGTYRQKTTEVGRFPPNAFGLYDMHGNVWEWCQDVWHSSYEGAPTDGSAWLKGGDQDRRVLRGGSWGAFPRYCRSASRLRYYPDNQYGSIGFRVVCSPPRTLP
ncbi:sulfatase-modifying factor protein [Halomicronema hongdechloris C2206]|uniref:Sulfatase-modifying factor protein n=1 Tax=Halomicronema hongdechloris C2206 TaxID=1641165 RepID=A0A1Z3HSU2_9CYAN|nr:SUMF1/EgtB/PvdO family nonheme iron enzyme [Halomicronema hongdechloris]ASC73373.1 sulfatase-modifying factor protein [Halomicronema hongdechloris C2206]